MARAPRSEPVDWPKVAGTDWGQPRTAQVHAKSAAVLHVAAQLAIYRELDPLLRRAVELSRTQLGLERIAFFLYDESGETLCGTWGTNFAGDTTDERHTYFAEGFHHREAKAQALSGLSPWLTFLDVPLIEQVEGRARVAGRGWNTITPILSRSGVIGLAANDTARTNAPVNEDQQLELAMLCRFLGDIIGDLRRTARELPWPSLLSRLPRVGEADGSSLAISAAHALHDDVTLTAEQLAKRLGVSASRLTRLFKQEMGVSLLDYKHRLRVERFFALVAPEGGNLLAAALDAGFGSYAQFHRVFRELMGTTPGDYLSRRK